MSKLPIIIHVPKTGGTTLFMAISGSKSPPRPNTLYRHVLLNDTKTEMISNCGDIFENGASEKYSGYKFIVMSRNPLDRLESEYGFFGIRGVFREVWERNVGTPFPNTFLEYVSHPTTSNSICKFLLGYKLYGDDIIDSKKVAQIISTFNELDFVFGLTKDMGLSIQNVEHQCGMNFENTLPRYRASLYKPERDDSWEKIESKFIEMNPHDLAIHASITEHFQEQTSTILHEKKFTFKGDKYDSIHQFISGSELRSPLEIYANDLDDPAALYDWVRERKSELEKLLQELIPKHRGNGKTLLIEWLERTTPEFLQDSTVVINMDDPLITVRSIVKILFQKT